MSETVTIPKKEYDALLKSQEKLNALEAGGVDNWEWYGESMMNYFGKPCSKCKEKFDEEDLTTIADGYVCYNCEEV
jgi:formylmethanofuran dehydrogenase subunit E